MTEELKTIEIKLQEQDDTHLLFGTHDKHIKIIEETTQTIIRTRGEVIQIQGTKEAIEGAAQVIRKLQELIRRGIQISSPDVITALKMLRSDSLDEFVEMYEEEIIP